MPTQVDINSIREQFPQIQRKIRDKNLIYLDNAASTLKVATVIESVTNHYRLNATNIHRGAHYLSDQGTKQFEQTRDSVKDFIGAKTREEIIFTKGTTDSLNLLASSLGEICLQEGSEILLSTMEHHSNIVPWQLIAEKTGAKVIEIPINDHGEILLDEYKALLNAKTKIVSIAHISNTLGTINPIAQMISLAHQHDAYFVVDAAQSIAHSAIDVVKLDCDFLAFSSHKMFAPTGLGVLYGKRDILEKMPPYQAGGAMIDTVSFQKTTFNDLPYKFEAGTPHIAGVMALNEAIKFILEIGFNTIVARENELLLYATKRLQEIKDLTIIGTAQNKSAVISFIIKDVHHQDLGMLLDQQGIAIRTGHHCTQPLMQRFNITGTNRISFSIYNTIEEIDYFMIALKKSLTLL